MSVTSSRKPLSKIRIMERLILRKVTPTCQQTASGSVRPPATLSSSLIKVPPTTCTRPAIASFASPLLGLVIPQKTLPSCPIILRGVFRGTVASFMRQFPTEQNIQPVVVKGDRPYVPPITIIIAIKCKFSTILRLM